MQKILNKREKIFVFLTFGAIVFSATVYFFIDPALSRNSKLNHEISFIRSKLKKYARLLNQKDYILDRYSKVSFSQGTFELSKNTLINALAEIENLAKLANIRITDIRPQNSQESTYKGALLELKAEGPLEGYMKFNYSIENSLFLLKIKRFQLNVKPDSADLEGTFTISQIFLE